MAEGYFDFTAGQTLTADQVETLLLLQGIMRFADASARNTALSAVLTEGLKAYLKDTNTETTYSGSAWSTTGPVHGSGISWTPTWTNFTKGSAAITAVYWRMGRLVSAYLAVTLAADSSVSGDVSFTLPVNIVTSTTGTHLGGCGLVDATDGAVYPGAIISKDADEAYIRSAGSGAAANFALSSTSPITWATSDQMRAMFSYVAASDA